MTNVYDCIIDYQYEERADVEPKRTLTEEEQQTIEEVVYDLILFLDTHGVCLGSETYFRLNDLDLCLVFPKWHSQEPVDGWDKIEVWDAHGIYMYGYMLPKSE